MLGREIRRLRQDANLTTLELAKAIGVKNRDVESWEDGTRPLRRNIEKLERFFEFKKGHLSNLPTTIGAKWEMVTYCDGAAVEYFATSSNSEAREYYLKNNRMQESGIRVWKNGQRLTYLEAEDLLTEKRDRVNFEIVKGRKDG